MSIILANFGKYAISDCPFIIIVCIFANNIIISIVFIINNNNVHNVTSFEVRINLGVA